MSSGIKYENGEIKLDIEYVLSAMSEEDQRLFVKAFSLQRNIIEHVINSICGEDPDGWWSSYEDEDRMNMFKRVEQAQLKNWSSYNWEFIREALPKAHLEMGRDLAPNRYAAFLLFLLTLSLPPE